jgi:hypothetical protein
LEAVFLLGVWQGFCKSQWRSTWKSPAKGPHSICFTGIDTTKQLSLELSLVVFSEMEKKCMDTDMLSYDWIMLTDANPKLQIPTPQIMPKERVDIREWIT